MRRSSAGRPQRSQTVKAPARSDLPGLGWAKAPPPAATTWRSRRAAARAARRSSSRKTRLAAGGGRSRPRSGRAAARSSRSRSRKPQPSGAASAAPTVLLPAAHEADEHDARGGRAHPPRAPRSRSVVELREGDGRARRRPRSRVSPSAARAATARAMAMRWSPCERTAAPRSGRPPWMTKPSGRSSTSAPIRARPSTSAAMRSLSLTRSSAAPVTRERALGVRGGHGQDGHLVDEGRQHRRRARPSRAAARSAPRSSPPAPGPRCDDAGLDRRAPIARSTSRNAVRRGFRSTPSMRTSESGRMSAATTRKAALETSPGHVTSRTQRQAAGARSSARARHARRATPKAGSRRSVWSRLGARLEHRRLALGLQPGEEDRRLHLRARHLQVPRAPRAAGRPRSSAAAARRWSSTRAPMARSGTRHALHRPAAQRRVAVSTERNGRPASTPASMRSVDPELPASRGPGGARQASGPSPAIDHVRARRAATSTPRRPGSAGWRRSRRRWRSRRIARLALRQGPQDGQPVRDRLVSRQGEAAAEAAGGRGCARSRRDAYHAAFDRSGPRVQEAPHDDASAKPDTVTLDIASRLEMLEMVQTVLGPPHLARRLRRGRRALHERGRARVRGERHQARQPQQREASG